MATERILTAGEFIDYLEKVTDNARPVTILIKPMVLNISYKYTEKMGRLTIKPIQGRKETTRLQFIEFLKTLPAKTNIMVHIVGQPSGCTVTFDDSTESDQLTIRPDGYFLK